MKIIADQNIYKIRSLTPDIIEVNYYNPAHDLPSFANYDALFVRTVTHINALSIPQIPTSLKLIGTASSGSDHIDADYFEDNGVKVIDAKGCNAKAVSEYVITSLLLWAAHKSISINSLSYGIIGVGAAGSAVQKQFDNFGLSYVCYDPPREIADPTFKSASLEEVLACDVLTFHTPLLKTGSNKTWHWLDEAKLTTHKFALIINAARGGIIDESALLKAMATQQVQDVIIDVWENEPDFNAHLAQKAFIATPHIAGYSEQAKVRATKIIVDKLCAFFEINSESIQIDSTIKAVEIDSDASTLTELLKRLNPIIEYDDALRNLISKPNKKALFRELREDRTYRFEYSFLSISKEVLSEFKELQLLGVNPL
ncbi:MAG: 4-phosphoerythronate dehydrogenase [Balneolaceae bacterium]